MVKCIIEKVRYNEWQIVYLRNVMSVWLTRTIDLKVIWSWTIDLEVILSRLIDLKVVLWNVVTISIGLVYEIVEHLFLPNFENGLNSDSECLLEI